MNWNRRYAIKSYLLSTVWTAPVLALVLKQATFQLTSMENFRGTARNAAPCADVLAPARTSPASVCGWLRVDRSW